MSIFSSCGVLLSALLVTFIPARAQNARATWKLIPVSPGQKITALSPGNLEAFRAAPIQLRAARGEMTNFQFVVTAGEKSIEHVEIKANGLASILADSIPTKNLTLYRENYVYVARPSGNRDLTPKWWPDALIPLDLAPQFIAARQSAVFCANLQIPTDAAPGDYFGELDFLCDGAPRRLALSVLVENKTLPSPKFRGTVALYYDVLRDWYLKNGQTFSDAEWKQQKKRYYEFLLKFRLNAYDLPVAWDDAEIETYLRDPRVHSVRMPPLDSPNFALALQKMKATGTLQKAFYYRIDEPQTPAQFAAVREITPRLRALGIRHLVTAHPNSALENAVDIWCPNLGDFFGINHLSAKALQSERKKGRETWFYTMVEPKFPAPTWLLDDDATSIGAFGSLISKYGFGGFVYSMSHGWGPKPLENLQSFAGTNGDGTLLYPAEIVGGVGPMPSLRLLLLRDLIEDVELGRTSQFATDSAPVMPSKSAISTKNQALAIQREGAPATEVNYRLDTKKENFIVHFRALKAQVGDYVAVELAPLDIEKRAEKWRFVMTRKGNLAVEKWTREGHFSIENSGVVGAVRDVNSVTNTELRIPLSILGNEKQFRFDFLRRTSINGAKITIYKFSRNGDPALMPVFRVR
ncbi:protein of unknown function (DUF4091) [Abditibacterium utsteinense]|uniref:Glycoside hydrolase 123 catalytic domain-containing protein n=1 Tax=Abditibacterium utsteinense TaxID=1960156 RepID=A0A2S8SR75_9BACT|nr:glycoside hydrolase domain-containing protein [Abditibacterium utsteinense]PQV63249.1 protein of unknown function (DUF4091) [Abditibacterium utsteinense]